MDASAGGILLTVALTALIIAAGLSLIFGDSTASRAARLANFTRRQGVTVTAESAPMVTRALAQSRFWRRLGVVVSLVAGVKVSVPFGSWSPGADRPNQEWITIFAGWFLGLIVAEWRAAGSAPAGARRAAGLASRRVRDFVPRTVRRRLAVAVAVALAIGGWLAVRLIVEETIRRTTLGLAACTLVAALLLGLTVRRVLTRPQTAADDAIRQADQGLRARSLTLLAGGAIVLLTWLGAVMLALIGLSYHPGPFTGPLAGVGGYGVLLALLGVIAGAYTGTEPTPPPPVRAEPTRTHAQQEG